MLRVPVIGAVGHERDSTLIDDVAAVACSTPTHAAEAAVPTDCREARLSLTRCAASLERAGRGAVGVRARHLAVLARGPTRRPPPERGALNQLTRARSVPPPSAAFASAASISAGSRWSSSGAPPGARRAPQRGRRRRRGRGRALGADARCASGAELERPRVALRAHDPQRTLERGYAPRRTRRRRAGDDRRAPPRHERLTLRFADGRGQSRLRSVRRRRGWR